MSKKTVAIALTVLLALALLFLCFTSFWQASEHTFSVIRYLEGEGYSSVRILQNIPEEHGCSPDDAYRLVFDAIPLEGEGRMQGKVCQDSAGLWYEEN